jgi:hypothetical protein
LAVKRERLRAALAGYDVGSVGDCPWRKLIRCERRYFARGLFEEEASPREIGGAAPAWQAAPRGDTSGTWVQIPGAVCFHFTKWFGFMN